MNRTKVEERDHEEQLRSLLGFQEVQQCCDAGKDDPNGDGEQSPLAESSERFRDAHSTGLLSQDHVLDQPRKYPLHYAAFVGNKNKLRELLEDLTPDERNLAME